MLDFLTLQTTAAHATFITALYTMLVAFLLSSLIGLTYERTYRGLSYSRNFVQALILSSMVAAIVMQAIGDSLARGLGMIGALAIIRFRTVFKDPRDIIFMFSSLAAGIACGVMAYTTGIVGTFGFCAAAFLLYYTPFGQTRFYDGMLRFSIASDAPGKAKLETILNEYCKTFALITLREMAQGNKLDYAYHVKLKKGKNNADFLIAVKKIESIEGVSLMLQETTVEV
jgi:uncharacterized membrane protein YhiD involved in acid resistance